MSQKNLDNIHSFSHQVSKFAEFSVESWWPRVQWVISHPLWDCLWCLLKSRCLEDVTKDPLQSQQSLIFQVSLISHFVVCRYTGRESQRRHAGHGSPTPNWILSPAHEDIFFRCWWSESLLVSPVSSFASQTYRLHEHVLVFVQWLFSFWQTDIRQHSQLFWGCWLANKKWSNIHY